MTDGGCCHVRCERTQVSLIGGIARDKLDAARKCDSLEESRALLLEVREAINTILEAAALARPADTQIGGDQCPSV